MVCIKHLVISGGGHSMIYMQGVLYQLTIEKFLNISDIEKEVEVVIDVDALSVNTGTTKEDVEKLNTILVQNKLFMAPSSY